MSLALTSLAATSFQAAPLVSRAAANAVSMSAINVGDIGTTRPLGVYDPLGLMTKNPEKYRRFQELEIKHGRIAMLAILHVITTGAGYKWSGYASYLSFPPLKFEDIPAGCERCTSHSRASCGTGSLMPLSDAPRSAPVPAVPSPRGRRCRRRAGRRLSRSSRSLTTRSSRRIQTASRVMWSVTASRGCGTRTPP